MAKAKVMKFKNEEQKRDTIIAALRTLESNLGWKAVRKALEANVEVTESKLHGDTEWDKDDTLRGLQDKRNDRVRLITLPGDLADEYEKAEEWPVDLDPYE